MMSRRNRLDSTILNKEIKIFPYNNASLIKSCLDEVSSSQRLKSSIIRSKKDKNKSLTIANFMKRNNLKYNIDHFESIIYFRFNK